MNRSRIREVLDARGLAPSKQFGQNFLCDERVREKIVAELGPLDGQHLLEVGPGLGALTGLMLEAGARVTAVEIDAGLASWLNDTHGGNERFQLIHGDVLKTDPGQQFDSGVGNLPYYCSSEILFRLLTVFHLPRLVAMVQKEMADRLLASAGTPEYGALTVSLGHYCTMRRAFNVGPDAFYPRPEVVSSVIVCEAREYARTIDPEENRIFHALVKGAFWGRRKTLYRSLSDAPELKLASGQVAMLLEQCAIDPKRRGETLTVEEYEQLAATAYAAGLAVVDAGRAE